METYIKPLGRKSYGSIGHLPCSRMGPGDHAVPDGMARICCEKLRDKFDRIIVQEKLDGSCVAVARIDGALYPLGRAGWPAVSSPYDQHRMFDAWVWQNQDRFMAALADGDRIVGEWLAQACATKYCLDGLEPFVAFDIMREIVRAQFDEFTSRAALGSFSTPKTLSDGPPIPVGDFDQRGSAMHRLGRYGHHGATDIVEGVVYRVERKGKVDFLAKYVRLDKVDGCYLPEISGQPAIWNWQSPPNPTPTPTNDLTSLPN